MEIRIQVKHSDEKVIAEETYAMTTEHYDLLACPEKMLTEKISELRNRVSESVKNWPPVLPVAIP